MQKVVSNWSFLHAALPWFKFCPQGLVTCRKCSLFLERLRILRCLCWSEKSQDEYWKCVGPEDPIAGASSDYNSHAWNDTM